MSDQSQQATESDHIEIEQMLRRARHPMSGQCIICGQGEYVGYEHTECQVRLVKQYAALVLPPHPVDRCASDCLICNRTPPEQETL